MKIKVDRDRCMGHARCYAMAADLFPLDDDGYVDLDEAVVPAGSEDSASDGESACPERAITLVSD